MGSTIRVKAFSMVCSLLLAAWMPPSVTQAAESAISEAEMAEAKKLFGSPYTEERYYRTDRLLVTATGSQVPVFKAPSVASLITAEEIDEMGANTLDEVLETVPGLHVAPSGVNNFSSIWSIRGLQTQINPHVLLLINGVPLTTTYNGGRPTQYRMPVAMISRVEIVRGPGSAVHGADAFSGVVNVITKDNFEIDGTRTGIRYGSFDMVDAWMQHGGTYKGWNVFASLETQHSNGDDNRIIDKDNLAGGPQAFRALTPGPLDTRYELTESHFGLRKDRFSFRFYGAWQNDNAMGPGGSQTITYGNKADGRQLIGDLEWHNPKLTADWDLSLRLYSVYLKSDLFYQYNPAGHPFYMLGNPIVTDKYTSIETTTFYTGFNRQKVRLAAGWKAFDTDTDQNRNFKLIKVPPFIQMTEMRHITSPDEIFMADQNRNLWFLSVQDEWSISPKWTFTGGVRYDEYSDFGSTVNPRLALIWEPLYYLTSKLLYGRAFRAPSFGQQYTKNNTQATGNPDLEPETMDTVELAFDFMPVKNFHAVLSLFSYKADDLSEIVNKTATNSGGQDGRGVEIEAEWDVSDTIKLRSNISYQHTENKNTGLPTADAPQMQVYVNPSWHFRPDWSLGGQFFWIGQRPREAKDPRADIDDYSIVNLILRRQNIGSHFEAAVAVDNLFDEDVREPSPYDATKIANGGAAIPNDYPMESRSLWAELRYKF